MIGILLQPSLSSTYCDGSPCSRTSAFLLQMLSQSRIMVGFGDDTLCRNGRNMPLGGRGDCQIAHAYIYSCDTCCVSGVGSATSISRASANRTACGACHTRVWPLQVALLVKQGHMLADSPCMERLHGLAVSGRSPGCEASGCNPDDSCRSAWERHTWEAYPALCNVSWYGLPCVLHCFASPLSRASCRSPRLGGEHWMPSVQA